MQQKKIDMELKKQLYGLCLEFVANRLKTIQQTIQELQESLTSETKSSAGDKHETGRAMIQLEREKTGQQLADTQKLNEVLSKMDMATTSKSIRLGSVVLTSKANYFIAISAGQFEVMNRQFFAISPNTPIGQLLLGKTVGNKVVFGEQSFEIEEVL